MDGWGVEEEGLHKRRGGEVRGMGEKQVKGQGGGGGSGSRPH